MTGTRHILSVLSNTAQCAGGHLAQCGQSVIAYAGLKNIHGAGACHAIGWRLRAVGIIRLDKNRNGSQAISDNQLTDFTAPRSEEHTSELQSLIRISYAVFCL